MNRDGANVSLWQQDIPNYQSVNQFQANKIYDVLIVGAGITGVTTAFLLQQAGRSCLLVEAHNPGFGTTGGTTAHLNTMLDTPYNEIESDFGKDNAKLVAQATASAIQLVEKLTRHYHIDCDFSYQDGYIYSQDKKQTKELDKIFAASERAGIPIAYTDNIPVPVSFEKAVRFAGQAQFHPTKFITSLLQEFERKGGVVLSNCLVQKVEEKDELVNAQTSRGLMRARQLVYATHLPPGVNDFSFKCAPYRSYVVAFAAPDSQPLDALVYDLEEPYHYFRTQSLNGTDYLIVGGADHKTGHEEHPEKSFLVLESYVKKLYGVNKVDFKWSSQFFEPVDGLPYIGKMPRSENLYVATGFSGNGITLGIVSALVLHDLLVNGESIYEKVFDATRIKPLASLGTFLKEQADVVGAFVGKRLNVQKIEALTALAPGEGAIVKYEGEKIALYKDEKGGVHALNPVCPHAKCFVAWNSTEKSWDCPCHGSRFDVEGRILTGPVMHELKKIDLASLSEEEPEQRRGSR
ncbi:MAG: FAD-dependent oxidoreductase [Saprospiraceae bacterium]